MNLLPFALFLLLGLFHISLPGQENYLKSVIYDFDGLNTGQTDLPDGDYSNNDLNYQVIPNPLGNSDMLGDRVLELNLNWTSAASGEFGKGTSRFYELDVFADYINFYIYNPSSNTAEANAEIIIIEDDDKNNIPDPAKDDIWKKDITVVRKNEWQLISLPLKDFIDDNIGGNGLFDAAYTNGAGMVFQVSIKFKQVNFNSSSEIYYIDMICFSEGPLPTGNTILDLPEKSSGKGCRLGAYTENTDSSMHVVPDEIEGLFPASPGKKILYVNKFLPFSSNGVTYPSKYPGNDIKLLLDKGYTPIITWEPLYAHLARLDPAQPGLQDIINGNFDTYIAQCAEILKNFNDTVIIRIMHEFEGDWYPWSLIYNNQDPNLYITAYRRFVDIFRAEGAQKVKWMWCVNSDPSPYTAYNWVISAYPGDNYVDYVATDIYNHPDPGVPDWKSFRYTGIESYYYLTKYFPHKPFIICEVASRERYSGEPQVSQTKSEWIKQMDKEMQSFFHKTIGLVFFSEIKEHDWRINSSQEVLNTVTENIWQDDYYFREISLTSFKKGTGVTLYSIFPNPSASDFTLHKLTKDQNSIDITVYSCKGSTVYEIIASKESTVTFGKSFAPGTYIVEASDGICSELIKVIKL